MAEKTYSSTIPWAGEGVMSAPNKEVSYSDAIARELGGIEINQNGPMTGQLSLEQNEPIWQTFRFPADFVRGVTGGKIEVPKLCGLHFNVEVASETAPVAGLDWFIDYWRPQRGWSGVAQGTAVGAPADGQSVWFKVNFRPLNIENFWWQKFRIGIRGRANSSNGITREIVPYDLSTHQVTIGNEVINVIPTISSSPLIEGERYLFSYQDKPAMLEMIGGDVYFSEQHGVKNVWYTSPNPFAEASSIELVTVSGQAALETEEEYKKIKKKLPSAIKGDIEKMSVQVPRTVGSDVKAYSGDGVTALTNEGREISLRFRVLSTAPDTDHDCTGSLYRTVAVVSDPESVRASVGELEDAYWLSAPNPSQFACEALYMDISEGGEAKVVDHLIIDPITPGVYMNIYYSDDEGVPISTEEWDGLMWTPVPKQYLLRRKESFALPAPITARYIKLEFTHLQPVWYGAGTFQRPTQYRKHPSWVWNYYLSLYEELRGATLEEASLVNVSFDALDLAYNYYLDDIRQTNPLAPETVQSAEGVSLLSKAVAKAEEEESNRVDANTLAKINLSMQRFRQQPAKQGSFGSVLQRIAAITSEASNYPVEEEVKTTANTSQVSTLERDGVIVEKQFPVTQFYLPCRHYYAVAETTFTTDRAYFVGIKEVAFTRDHYETNFDHDLYYDTAGDTLNIETNDLELVDHSYVTYTEK